MQLKRGVLALHLPAAAAAWLVSLGLAQLTLCLPVQLPPPWKSQQLLLQVLSWVSTAQSQLLASWVLMEHWLLS
jgi:hypothetical protein